MQGNSQLVRSSQAALWSLSDLFCAHITLFRAPLQGASHLDLDLGQAAAERLADMNYTHVHYADVHSTHMHYADVHYSHE
ncbi:unnamed protein product [Boreogadus saida]